MLACFMDLPPWIVNLNHFKIAREKLRQNVFSNLNTQLWLVRATGPGVATYGMGDQLVDEAMEMEAQWAFRGDELHAMDHPRATRWGAGRLNWAQMNEELYGRLHQ